MASRVGICAHASLLAAQLLRIREAWPSDVWTKTGKVQVASSFLGSLICGKWVGMGEAEAAATGMWVHGGQQDGYWDEGVMEIVGGSREEGRKIRGWLGEVELAGGKRVGHVSKYMVDRYGFDPGTQLTALSRSRYIRADCICAVFQTQSLHSLPLITFPRTFPFVPHRLMQSFPSVQWMLC